MGIADMTTEIVDRFGMLRDLFKSATGTRGKTILSIVVVILLLYYPVGMIWVHKISDDLDYEPPAEFTVDAEKGSKAVAIAAALIDREINQNRWTANDPFFIPSAALDNMPNFQQGVIGALSRFAFELTDQLGRTRGSSQSDPDLREAAGLLQYSGTKWHWDPSISLMPTAASEKQYEKAMKSLLAYNKRLAAGNAVFERRGDNLLATLDRIALDLGATTASLEKHLADTAGNIVDFRADDIFYGIKGQIYTYYLLVKALGEDFSDLVNEKKLNGVWQALLQSMHKAAALDPFVVVNGAPDGQIAPSHLSALGFYAMRARTQLRELTNILLK